MWKFVTMSTAHTHILYILIVAVCVGYVFIHVSTYRIYSRKAQADDAKTRQDLKRAMEELKELSANSDDKYELDEVSKMIDKADKKTLRYGKQYLNYIRKLSAKKRDANNLRQNSNNTRRFLGWFKTLTTPSASTKMTTLKTKTTTTHKPIVLKEWTDRVEDANLTVALKRLIDILYKINENLQQSQNDALGYYIVKVPTTTTFANKKHNNVPLARFKRESLAKQIGEKVKVNNETENSENNTNVHNIQIVPAPLVRREKRDVRDSPMIELTYNKIGNNKTERINNDTMILDSVVTNVTNDLLNRANTRRNNSPQDSIRAKLFAHLYDIFDEIKQKLEPVERIKNEYSNNVAFKVGYISANLDTLGSNLARLRADMDENSHSWSDHKVLDLFDVLKIHHDVVLKLLDSLRFHLSPKPDDVLDLNS